jgi:hypothetical protein
LSRPVDGQRFGDVEERAVVVEAVLFRLVRNMSAERSRGKA